MGDTISIRFQENSVQFDASTELIDCQIKLESQESVKILCKNSQSLMFKYAFLCKSELRCKYLTFLVAKAAKMKNSTEVLIQMGVGLPLSLCL